MPSGGGRGGGFRNNDLDLYTQGSRSYNIRYFQHTADFTPIDLRLRNYLIHAGIRWDYFDYYGQLLAAYGTSQSLNDDHYFSYYCTAELDNENRWYFPSRGTRLRAAYFYRTDNLIGMGNNIGISDISAYWRVSLSPTDRFTLQPLLYARFLLGGEVPLAFINAIGGEWFGHSVEQQMPFAGIGHMEKVGNQLVAAQLQAHYRILSNHYLLLRVAAAITDNTLHTLPALPSICGIQAGYSYITFFGPVEARIGYTNHTRLPYFFLSLGHVF